MLDALATPDVAGVARRLLGAVVTSELGDVRVSVRLTEVEAYAGVGEDPASHAHRGRTPRNAVMFGPPGRAYLYFVYGMHWCLNVVTGPAGHASAVLLRAGEVVEGLEAARSRRPSAGRDRDLARGPARLAATLGITSDTAPQVNNVDLLGPRSPVRVLIAEPTGLQVIESSARVGVGDAAAETPWRFLLAGEETVSPYRRASGR